MFYEKEYKKFASYARKFSNAILKPSFSLKFTKFGEHSSVIHKTNEAIRDCRILCRRIKVLNNKFISEVKVPKEFIEDLDKMIYLFSNETIDKLMEIIEEKSEESDLSDQDGDFDCSY